MIRSLLRIGRKGFCTKAAADATIKASATISNKPKWMKFFEGQDPIKIDLERSIKSENLELIQNYIKNNYHQFDDYQLVQVVPKVCRSNVIESIKAEIKLRIIGNNFNLTVPQHQQFLEYMEDIPHVDRLIVLYTLAKVSENFSEYTHFQQYKVIQLAIKYNKLSLPISLQFLDYFNENQELFKQPEEVKKEYFDKFDHIQFTQYMTVLSNLKELLLPEEFNGRVSENALKTISDLVMIHFLYFKLLDRLRQQQQKYLEKITFLEQMNENVSQLHLDKIFNPDVIKILPYNSKIAYKKLLVRMQSYYQRFFDLVGITLWSQDSTMRPNSESIVISKMIKEQIFTKRFIQTLFIHATQQKALGILRTIVQPNERELVEKVLILIGNQIMSREISDFKFDFRLFSYMTKYQYAYKYYIDESFISMKSLLRSLFFNTKKASDEGEYNAYHILLQKYKAYNDLNYFNIIKQSEDFYSRKVDFSDTMVNQWIQLQKDIQQCLKDYLNQQVASGILTKLMHKIPHPVDKEEDESALQDESEVDVLAIEETTEETPEGKEEENNKNGQDVDSKTAEKLKDEDFKKQLQYKAIELQANLQQLKYVKTITFNSRIQYSQTVLLRHFINTTECIAQNLYFCEPTEDFIHAVKLWVKQDKLVEMFDHFCMIPSFLESLLMIEAYGKVFKGQQWFSPELNNKMFKTKFQIEEFFNKEQEHKEREPFKYIKHIESEIASLPTKSLPLDKAYDQHNFLYEIISNSFQVSSTLFEAEKQKTTDISEGKIVMQRKRDLLTEQFIWNKDNLLRKILHSQIYSYFVNETHLKKYVGEILYSVTSQVQKNVVFYPFYADFIIPNKKIVIQVLEKNKMIDGVENTLSGFNQLNEIFLKKIGYTIVYIDHTDFEIDYKSFQNNILKKITKVMN